jgi:hypothetical protein
MIDRADMMAKAGARMQAGGWQRKLAKRRTRCHGLGLPGNERINEGASMMFAWEIGTTVSCQR